MNEYHEKFSCAIELFNKNLFWDAIELFEDINSQNCPENIKDDIILNIAICYLRLGVIEEARKRFLAICNGHVGDGFFDVGENNVGKTTDRALLGLFRISLVENDVVTAKKLISKLENEESGLILEGEFTSFYQIALTELNNFSKLKGKKI